MKIPNKESLLNISIDKFIKTKKFFEKLNLLLIRQKYPSSSFNSSQLLHSIFSLQALLSLKLLSFFFLSHSFILSQSFSCFNPRNKNTTTTTTTTTRFVPTTTRSVSLPLSAISDSLSRLCHG